MVVTARTVPQDSDAADQIALPAIREKKKLTLTIERGHETRTVVVEK